jgi:hypothetical protein
MTRSRRNSIVQDFLVPLQTNNQDSEDASSTFQLQFQKRLSVLGNEIETMASVAKSRGGGNENMKSHAALQQLFLSSENRPRQWQPDQEGEFDSEVAISGFSLVFILFLRPNCCPSLPSPNCWPFWLF